MEKLLVGPTRLPQRSQLGFWQERSHPANSSCTFTSDAQLAPGLGCRAGAGTWHPAPGIADHAPGTQRTQAHVVPDLGPRAEPLSSAGPQRAAAGTGDGVKLGQSRRGPSLRGRKAPGRGTSQPGAVGSLLPKLFEETSLSFIPATSESCSWSRWKRLRKDLSLCSWPESAAGAPETQLPSAAVRWRVRRTRPAAWGQKAPRQPAEEGCMGRGMNE